MLDLLKTPPNDIEAEEALLAAIFIDNRQLENAPDLSSDDFYHNSHRKIFKSILSLKSRKQPADLVTVATHLRDSNLLDEIGGASFLAQIAEAAPMALNVSAYAGIIKKKSLARQVMRTASELCQKALEGMDGDKLLDLAQSEMMQIQPTSTGDNIQRVSDMIAAHLDRIEHFNTHKEARGYPTGFPNIDNCLSIIGPKLIVIAGRPKMGKTAFATTIMRNMDRLGICTGLLSIEMPGPEILDRWLAQTARINGQKFGRYKGLTPDEFLIISDAANELLKSKMLIDDSGSIGIEAVKRKCRKMVKEGARVVFVDQLSQIRGRAKEDRFERFANNVNELAILKKELGIPIVLLAQLNRNLEQRANKEPIMSDLKMTGNLEEDADAVIFVHRPEVYATNDNERDALKGTAIINLALNRHGGTWRDTGIMFQHEFAYYFQSSV